METIPLLKKKTSSVSVRRGSQLSSDDDSIYKQGVDPAEKAFVRKLDFFLMVSSMLGYFIKYLNQSNIAVAYNNGMDDYFDMGKNQYNYLLSIWTAGYILGQLPANYLIHHRLVNFRYGLGFLQVGWCILAIFHYYSTSLNQLYALRFILAVLEAPLFVSLEYLLGSWYSPTELTKRSTYLAISSGMAGIIAGPLQQVIIELSKTSSVPPFKLNFLLDAAISLPVAGFTLLANPNTPQDTNNWYWTETDKIIAKERRLRLGDTNPKVKPDLSYRSLASKWQVWLFPLMFWAFNNSSHAVSQPTLVSWMKLDLNLSPAYFNTIPSIIHVVGSALALCVGYYNDYKGLTLNHIFLKIYFVCMIVGCVLLSVWKIPNWLHWFSYALISIPGSWCQPQIFSWINRILVKDDTLRAFVISVTNTLAYVIGCWVPIFVWNTNDRPEYFVGFVYTTILSAFGLVMTYLCDRNTQRDLLLGVVEAYE